MKDKATESDLVGVTHSGRILYSTDLCIVVQGKLDSRPTHTL